MGFIQVGLAPRRQSFQEQLALRLQDEVSNVLLGKEEMSV